MIWTAPHLLDSYDIMSNRWGDFNAKGSAEQTIYARIQKTGDWNHAGREIKLQRNLS